MAVVFGPLIGDAERLPAGHDGHAIDGVRARHQQPENGVPALVICDALALVRAHDQLARGAEHEFLERVHEVSMPNVILVAPGG